MDNDNKRHLERFSQKFKHFAGAMCNMGAADLGNPEAMAEVLWSLRETGGWIGIDQHSLKRYIISAAKGDEKYKFYYINDVFYVLEEDIEGNSSTINSLFTTGILRKQSGRESFKQK